jgi:hypothetical protein
MKRSRHFLRDIALCSITALIAGCSDGTGPAGGCPQTSEFANFGCARIRGTVRNPAGVALAGARVSLTPPPGAPNPYDSPSVDTDARGLYALEIHDYGPPPATTSPDTVPMYVRAFLLSGQAPSGDSVLVNVIFAPVGAVPEVVEVDFALD